VVALLVAALLGYVHPDPVVISQSLNWAVVAFAAGYFAYLLFFAGLDLDERKRVVAMIALFVACVMFWAGFEQAGASFNLFAERYTDRNMFGWEVPAGTLQAVNPFFIILFAPVFAALWVNLGRRNLDPSAPAKFAIGLVLMGFGFLVMFLAARYVVAGETVLPTWLILTYLLHTFGELCLSPVGLSSMTKLAPARFAGQVMGVWFLGTALGNNLAGQFSGEIDPNNLPSMSEQFLFLFWWGFIAGVVLLVLTPFIRKMMVGVK
jgi:POT family proton-dependent oligopeptide transporter